MQTIRFIITLLCIPATTWCQTQTPDTAHSNRALKNDTVHAASDTLRFPIPAFRDTLRPPARDTARSQKHDTSEALPKVRTLTGLTITGRKPSIERRLDRTVVNMTQNIVSEGGTVLEAMQHLPGVQVTADGQVSINGKSGANVYIDGKPTYLSAEDLTNLLSGMSASSVQQIEIMTLPPSKYDASGTAGLINIVKKKNQKQGFNGSLNGSLIQGNYGRYNGGVTGNYRNKHFNLYFNGAYIYNKTLFGRQVSSNYLDIGGRLITAQLSDNRNTTTRRTFNPTAGIDWFVSSGTTLSLSATGNTGSFRDQILSQLTTRDQHHLPVSKESFLSESKDYPYNYTTTLQWSQRLDTSGQAFTLDLDYSTYIRRSSQNNMASLFDTLQHFLGETNALLQQTRDLYIYSAQAGYVYPLKKGRIEAGLKSSYVRIRNYNAYYNQLNGSDSFDSSQSINSLNTERINAAYATVNYSLPKTDIQLGLRAEQARSTGTDQWKGYSLIQQYFNFFPTLFVNRKIDKDNNILVRLGRRTERPDYSEMIPFRRPLTPTLYFQGNPNLRPQLTWHGEIGWSWRNMLSVTVSADRDRDYMQTLPYVDPGDTTITRRPTNVNAHSWNVDIGFSKQLTPWWTADNSLSVYRNAFEGSGNGYWKAASGIVSVDLHLSNSLRISERWRVQADGEYSSERQLLTSRFGSYFLVNTAVRCSMWKGRGSITLNAHNIFQSEGHNAIDHYTGLYQYSEFNYYSRYLSCNLTYRIGTGKLTRNAARSGSAEEQGRAGN